tara:strand:- start:759 stop:911 length:153 start_codon:yes stop_codon:yes gene_type:complete
MKRVTVVLDIQDGEVVVLNSEKVIREVEKIEELLDQKDLDEIDVVGKFSI